MIYISIAIRILLNPK